MKSVVKPHRTANIGNRGHFHGGSKARIRHSYVFTLLLPLRFSLSPREILHEKASSTFIYRESEYQSLAIN